MKKRIFLTVVAAMIALSATACATQTQATTQQPTTENNTSKLEETNVVHYGEMKDRTIHIEEIAMTEEWDKVFPLSDEVNHKKVTFTNHFGITLAADMYEPKEYTGKLPAIAVCGPFGAVKEQSSGLYAQEMAKKGFLTIAFDPSFTGESSGYPRAFNSPDINVEDYQAAIDFLSTQENVDPEKIGIIGICGWGGMAV